MGETIFSKYQPCHVINNYYINFGGTTVSVDSNNTINYDRFNLALFSSACAKENKKHTGVLKWIVKGLIFVANLLMKIHGNIPIPPLDAK